MAITSQHVTGFVVGVGTAAFGYYMYKKNQTKVDAFLASQGIKLPGGHGNDYPSMSLEELVGEKEKIEDIIAEKEMSAAETVTPVETA